MVDFNVIVSDDGVKVNMDLGGLSNPVFLVVMIILAVVLVFLALKFLEKKRDAKVKIQHTGSGIVFGGIRRGRIGDRHGKEEEPLGEYSIPQPILDEKPRKEDLKRKENDLKSKEVKLKERKKHELEEKEHLLERRHVKEVLKDERHKIERSLKADGEDRIDRMVEHQERLDEVRNKRNRVRRMIELAETRYREGKMSEKNFRRIVSDYQKQLIDLDIEEKRTAKEVDIRDLGPGLGGTDDALTWR